MKITLNRKRTSGKAPVKIIVTVSVICVLVLIAFIFRGGETTGDEQSHGASAISVNVVEAKKKDLQSWVFAEGTARSASREFLNFQSSGRIAYVDPDLREGSMVQKGALLASLDQRRIEADLTEARTNVEVAKTDLDQALSKAKLAQKTFERYSALVGKESASQQEYDDASSQLDTAKADVARARSRVSSAEAKLTQIEVVQEDTELRAPMDGMIAYFNIEQGYYFDPSQVRVDTEENSLNTMPIVLIDPDSFEIEVEIPDFERGRVRPDQTVYIKAGSGSGADLINSANSVNYIEGKVFSVNPAVSPFGRAIKVEIHTTLPTTDLRDGMFVTAWIAADVARDQVVVPMETLLFRSNQPYAFVVDRQSLTSERRDLAIGLSGADEVAVTKGIEAGDLVVSDGRYQLSTGTQVELIGRSLKALEKNTEELKIDE